MVRLARLPCGVVMPVVACNCRASGYRIKAQLYVVQLLSGVLVLQEPHLAPEVAENLGKLSTDVRVEDALDSELAVGCCRVLERALP